MTRSGRFLRFRITLMLTIFAIVGSMTIGTVALILTVSSSAMTDTASTLFEAAAVTSQATIETILGEARTIANTAPAVRGLMIPPDDAGLDVPAREYLEESLKAFSHLYSAYVGYDDGRFVQLIDVRSDERIGDSHDAPEGTRLILRTITGADADRVESWSFLDSSNNVIASRRNELPEYDPRVRPWYTSANNASATFTDPYVFNSLQQPGITASRLLPGGAAVFGVDITLDTIQGFIDQYDGVRGGGLMIVDSQNRIIAAQANVLGLFGIAKESSLLAAVSESVSRLPATVTQIPDTGWFATRRVRHDFSGREWSVVSVAPIAAFSEPFLALQKRIVLAALTLLALIIPVVLRVAGSMSRVLTSLAVDARRIANLEFVDAPPITTRIREFHDLSSGFTVMKGTLAQRTADLDTTLTRLRTLVELNIAISAEQSIDHLTELILSGARRLSHADGGSLYLINPERNALDFRIVLNETLGFRQGGTSGNPVTLPSVSLYDEAGNNNEHNVVTSTFHSGETVNIDDAYDATGFDFSGTRKFDEANRYRSKSFLTVPLKPRGARIIGAMQLINSIDPDTGEIVPFSAEIQRFVEALSAGAATALYNRDLLETQKQLFDSLIQLIAGAIDAKSPYTGGHCARVPEIALMLAKEAQNASTGTLADFDMGSEDDWRAFRLGAWLHDAGKVTTPEFVVDKATKLETIYDRIHEIRTRFEVLLRDARIDMYEEVVNGASFEEAEARYRRSAEQLRDDFAFIARRNMGSEALSPEDEERLQSLAARRWFRHFDDQIGISWVELDRCPENGCIEPADIDSPIEERLLIDKPRHRVPRPAGIQDAYATYDFALEIPELLYNRGELYNLTIGRGTLTREERFKINEHVMQTIRMLDSLPLPQEMKRVVEYAGTHHEALNGSGYPYGLTGRDLSVPARVMAIADIFEALTASDRPYKKPKPLSVVVEILHKFKTDGHIDGELFDLFLTSGVYRRYAEQFLKPEQIDEVDIAKYVG